MKHYTRVMILGTVLMLVFQSAGISFTLIAFGEEATVANLVIEYGTSDYILAGEERQLKAVRSYEDGRVEDVIALSNWFSCDETMIYHSGVLLGKYPGEVTAEVYDETSSTSLSTVDYQTLEAQVTNNM